MSEGFAGLMGVCRDQKQLLSVPVPALRLEVHDPPRAIYGVREDPQPRLRVVNLRILRTVVSVEYCTAVQHAKSRSVLPLNTPDDAKTGDQGLMS